MKLKLTLQPFIQFALAIAALLCAITLTAESAEVSLAGSLTNRTPQGLADLRTIEQAAQQVSENAIACTVGLRVGRAYASGVVVNKEGYVLTAAHVIGRPGREAEIRFPDGTVVRGKTLGMNVDVDGGMVRITDSGTWPFAPVATPNQSPKSGDWCLATGNPGGFQRDRTPPLRLGRVIEADRFVIRTDCAIFEGDSGGPLFDMLGRVIGIHSRIAEPLTVNLHVPSSLYLETWQRLAAGQVHPQSRFLDRFDSNMDGKVSRPEIPAGTYREVFDRLAVKFGFDPKGTYTIQQLSRAIGWESTPLSGFVQERGPIASFRFRRDPSGPQSILPRDRYVRGRSVVAVFRDIPGEAHKQVVEISSNGKKVALGTVVGEEGWILTKASQLREDIACTLHDGRRLPAKLVRTEPRFDLALLKVETNGLRKVKWASAGTATPGSWLITAGLSRSPVSIGVMSVEPRLIARTPGFLGVRIDPASGLQGAQVSHVEPRSGAEKGGLKRLDMITHVMEARIRDFDTLKATVQKYRVGDTVQLRVLRNGREIRLPIVLGMLEDSFRSNIEQMSGPLSGRRNDFPEAFQHDSVLHPTDCGGPVIDLSGHLVGINIARTGRTCSYAIPSTAIQELLEDLIPKTASAASAD